MSSKAEQKQKSHQAILESAATLLRQRGIAASSVLDVMKGAGLTVGGFYGHFDSKEQLFTATLKHAAGIMWQKLLENARGSSPRERVVSVLRSYLSREHRDTPEAGCFLPNVAAEVAREGEPYRSALAAELTRFVDSLSAILDGDGAGAESGKGNGSGRSRETALGLIALMFGALSLARTLAGTPLSDEFLAAARRLGARAVSDLP
jgi:TetR/AcrR family transcriptional repressor of nem operon